MTAVTSASGIRRASGEDRRTVVEVLAEAFLFDTTSDWLVPEVGERRKVYENWFRILVDDALERGLIEVTGDGSGVAVWFPHLSPRPEPPGIDAEVRRACGRWASRFFALLGAMAAHHPGEPHQYLALVAVTPSCQGRGVGSDLLVHHHAWLDEHRVSGYLEATNTRNRDLYLRHGYEAGQPFRLPDGGPPLWPMWRAPSVQAG